MRIAPFYIRHCLIGFGLSALFTGALILGDVASLGYLVSHVSGGWLAVLMLWIFNGIVFAPVQFCIALWLRAEAEDDHRGGGTAAPVAQPVPIRVRS